MVYSHDHEASQDFSRGTGICARRGAPSLEDQGRRRRRSWGPSGLAPRTRGSDRGSSGRVQGLSRSIGRRNATRIARRGAGGRRTKVRPGSNLTLLDASALLSLLLGQPAGAEVSALLGQKSCAIPASCLTEVVDKLIRKRRVEPAVVSERVGPLIDEAISVLPVDRRIGWRAGELHAEHYDRSKSALSLADCILLASAGSEDEIATSDGALARTAHRIGISVIPLPDSRGRRPRVS